MYQFKLRLHLYLSHGSIPPRVDFIYVIIAALSNWEFMQQPDDANYYGKYVVPTTC